MKMKVLIAAALAMACGAAWSADSGFYVGAGLGWSDVSSNVKYTYKDSEGFKDSSSDKFSGSDFAYTFVVGYDFNKYAAVELGYLDLGKPSDTFKDNSEPPYVGKDKVDITLNGIDLAVVGKYPFADSFDVHAKLGVIWWTPKVTDVYTETDSTDSTYFYKDTSTIESDSTDLLIGVGASYMWGEHLVLSLDWQHIELGGSLEVAGIDNTDAWLFGAAWKF